MIDVTTFSAAYPDRIAINTGRKIIVLHSHAIHYIEACNYYILIHTCDHTHVVRETLKEFLTRLRPGCFLQIHRSLVLHLSILRSLETKTNQTIVKTTIGKDFPVSRYRKKNIEQLLMS